MVLERPRRLYFKYTEPYNISNGYRRLFVDGQQYRHWLCSGHGLYYHCNCRCHAFHFGAYLFCYKPDMRRCDHDPDCDSVGRRRHGQLYVARTGDSNNYRRIKYFALIHANRNDDWCV